MIFVAIPVGVGQLSWFWQLMEAVDARAGLAHGLAVKAPTIKVGQLLPVVLLILVQVVVVGTRNLIQGFCVGLLRLRSPAEGADKNLWNRCTSCLLLLSQTLCAEIKVTIVVKRDKMGFNVPH